MASRRGTSRILGVDPGSRYTGYGVIDKRGNAFDYVTAGRVSAGSGKLVDRLEVIFRELTAVIESNQPTVAAVEGLFHHRNASSALKLGHARGVAIVACQLQGLEIHEYQPSVVKQALTGSGRAGKQQVQKMVQRVLNIREELELDASDALAVAITYAQRADIDARLAAAKAR